MYVFVAIKCIVFLVAYGALGALSDDSLAKVPLHCGDYKIGVSLQPWSGLRLQFMQHNRYESCREATFASSGGCVFGTSLCGKTCASGRECVLVLDNTGGRGCVFGTW